MAAIVDFLVQFGGFGMFLSALLAGVVILGEAFYAEQWLGAMLILAGAIGMEVFEGRTGRHIPGAPR